MRFSIVILFIAGLVVGFADVGSAESGVLEKIKTGQIELKPKVLISLLSAIFYSATSKLHEGKGVDDTLLASLYAILLFIREVVGYLGGIVGGNLKGLLKGIGGSLNGLVSGLGSGIGKGNLVEGLLRGVSETLAGGADKGSNGLGLGFGGALHAVIN